MALPLLLRLPMAAVSEELPWYNSTAAIQTHFASLARSCNITVNPALGQVDWQGSGVLGVLFTDPNNAATAKRKSLLNFATHGRDYGLPELALRFAHKLCDGSERSRQILLANDILMIPVLNVAGRTRVEDSLDSVSCGDLRKNANYVDIDSNFETDWIYGNSNPTSGEFRGPYAASEDETKLLVSIQYFFKPDIFVDLQSGNSVALAYPHWSSFSNPVDSGTLERALTYVVRHTPGMCEGSAHAGTNACPKIGSIAKSTLPPAKSFGTAVDWFHNSGHGSLAFVFQTFSGSLITIGSSSSSSVTEHERNLVSLSSAGHTQSALSHDVQSQHSALAVTSPSPEVTSSEMNLLLTGKLAGGALYDPIVDCISYYAPIRKSDFDAWIALWEGALLVFFQYFTSVHKLQVQGNATALPKVER